MGQCCLGACKDSAKNKYFSIADDSGPWLCGETCIRDSFYWVFHLFEKNLTKAADMNTCKDAGYTEYKETVTHGGGGLDCTLDLYACSKAGGCEHPGASAASLSAPAKMRNCTAQIVMKNATQGQWLQGDQVLPRRWNLCRASTSGLRWRVHMC